MSLQRYEMLMLAVPEITQDEQAEIEKNFDTIVRKAQGSIISFERWGKYRLAYPVKKNDYGVYLLTRFEIPQATSALEEIKALFVLKFGEFVMRNLLEKLDPKQSLEYQRPKSLEEAPEASETRGFMKDHRRIEGLISAVESSDAKSFHDDMGDEDSDEEMQ
jgi:small subunit ribosomal protein S6